MSKSEALAGLFAGIINDSILYIPDNIKYIQQNGRSPPPLTFANVKNHFRGSVPIICVGSGLSYAVYFYLYGLFKSRIESILPNDNVSSKFLVAAIAGSLAILPSTLVYFPFDTVKKHLSLQFSSEITFKHVVRQVYTTGGIKGFFFGWYYTIARDLYMSALKMALFEGASKWYASHLAQTTTKSSTISNLIPNWFTKKQELNEQQQQLQLQLPQSTLNTNQSTINTTLPIPHTQNVFQTTNNMNTTIPTRSSNLESSALSIGQVAGVGSFVGILTSLLSLPVDCVVSRLRSNITPPEAKKSFITCVKWMLQNETTPKAKVFQFFRGGWVRTSNYCIGSSVFWTLFAKFQKGLETNFPTLRKD